MKKMVFLILIIFTSVMIPGKVAACKCAKQLEPNEALEHAKAVFAGKVLEVKQRTFDDRWDS